MKSEDRAEALSAKRGTLIPCGGSSGFFRDDAAGDANAGDCYPSAEAKAKCVCCSVSECLRAPAAVLAIVLAAFAISYLSHLTTTGAGASFGLLGTLSAASSACTLQDMLVAVPFGVLVWRRITPPCSFNRSPKSACLLALAIDVCIFAAAAMSSTHHLGSLYADRSHLVLSLLFFAVLWAYLLYALSIAFRWFSTFAMGLFVAPSPTDAADSALVGVHLGADASLDCEGGSDCGGNDVPEGVHSSSTRTAKGRTVCRFVSKLAANIGPNARIFLISLIVLLVAWSPYVILMAPGSDCADMAFQVGQFVNGSYSSHHPLYSTFVYGAVFSFGNSLAGANAGLLAMMLFQTLALALVLSFEIVELSKMRFGRPFRITVLLFFAVVPVFGAYCQWIVKDSLFGACFALYVTVYVRCCLRAEEEGVSVRDLVLLLGVSLVAGLLRNNAFYAVAFAAIAFALIFRKKLTAAKFVLLLAVIPLTMGLNQAAIIGTNALKGDMREALSIPFQQTARYAVEHSDDVTDEEWQAIDAVLDCSNLADRYQWNVSDPVKAKAKTGDKAALAEYFKVWAAQGLRHPVCYIESFLDQSFGYWSLADPRTYGREFAGCGTQYVGKALDVTTGNFFPKVAGKAWQILMLLRDAPLLSVLSISGFYTLAGLVLAALALYRGMPRAIILLVPSAVLLLTCVAGPLNGSIRYSFGNIAAFPIIAGAVLYSLYGRDRAHFR